MPTVTVRVSVDERARLEGDAAVRGCSLSELVREALGLRSGGVEDRVVDLERRVRDLERLAGVM